MVDMVCCLIQIHWQTKCLQYDVEDKSWLQHWLLGGVVDCDELNYIY